MDLLDELPGRLPGLSPKHSLLTTVMTMVGRNGTMVVKRINELIMFIVGKAIMSPLPVLGPPSSGIISIGMEKSGRKATGTITIGRRRLHMRVDRLRQMDGCSLVKEEIDPYQKIIEEPTLCHNDRQEILRTTRKYSLWRSWKSYSR